MSEQAAAASTLVEPKAIMSLEGILRGVGILLSIIAFACVADTPYEHFSKLEFTLAAGIIAFIWLFFSLISLMFRAMLSRTLSILPLIYLALDVITCLFMLIGGITAAAFCSQKIDPTDIKYCSNWSSFGVKNPYRHNIPASSVFSFFTAILLGVLAFFSFRNWRK